MPFIALSQISGTIGGENKIIKEAIALCLQLIKKSDFEKKIKKKINNFNNNDK